jgi:hypothetical protein
MLVLALVGETMHIEWRIEFIAALAWLCLVLSVGATMLLLFLLRRGAASRIASLFYLVPPVTAFMAYLLFGETLGPAALVGMAVTAFASPWSIAAKGTALDGDVEPDGNPGFDNDEYGGPVDPAPACPRRSRPSSYGASPSGSSPMAP